MERYGNDHELTEGIGNSLVFVANLAGFDDGQKQFLVVLWFGPVHNLGSLGHLDFPLKDVVI